MKRLLVPAILLLTVPSAGQTADLAVQRSAEPKALLAADAGAGAFAGEGMTSLHGLVLGEDENWRVLVEARLRLRTFGARDGDPAIRREDWDEPSDVAHVLRELTYSSISDQLQATWYLYVGIPPVYGTGLAGRANMRAFSAQKEFRHSYLITI